ncbi:MAG: hemerythrin domain-containing protein [Magnetococcus sp. YQC-5]
MDIREIALSLKVDHAVILDMFEQISAADRNEARKLFTVLRQLLIKHFFMEEFCFYPLAIRMKKDGERMQLSLYGGATDEYLKGIVSELKEFHSVGENVIKLMNECLDSDENFKQCMEGVIVLVKARIEYEESVLLNTIDTSSA